MSNPARSRPLAIRAERGNASWHCWQTATSVATWRLLAGTTALHLGHVICISKGPLWIAELDLSFARPGDGRPISWEPTDPIYPIRRQNATGTNPLVDIPGAICSNRRSSAALLI